MQRYHIAAEALLSLYLLPPLSRLIMKLCIPEDCLFVQIDGSKVLDSRDAKQLQAFRDAFNFSMFGNVFHTVCEDELDLSQWCIHMVDPLVKQDKGKLRALHKQTQSQCGSCNDQETYLVAREWLFYLMG